MNLLKHPYSMPTFLLLTELLLLLTELLLLITESLPLLTELLPQSYPSTEF